MEGIVITDADLLITDANPAFCRVMELEFADILSENLCNLKPSMNDPYQSAAMWAQLQESGHWGGEICDRKQSGELEPEWLTVSAIKNEHNEISNYVAIFSSISELIKRQQMLEGIANHDPLTGLPNRRLLTDRLHQAMLYATRNDTLLAVCYLDLDGFKQVNDVFGHAAGDELLQETAHRLKCTVRCNDTVCRLGGDEFVLLINDLHKREDVAVILDKVLAIIQEPVELETDQVYISASIGVSFFANDSDDANQLMLYADQAMYRAKHQGKSKYCGVYLI
jgi:diguanylate cyclase (GGDEF)-like protein